MRDVVIKPWGVEEVIASTLYYLGKILRVNRGHRLSLQYHREKIETMYCLSGRAIVELNGEARILDPGQSIEIANYVPHRLSARLSDIVIIEVSTPYPDDVVRLEDDYGRVGNGEEAGHGQKEDREDVEKADPKTGISHDGDEPMGDLQGQGEA